MMITLNIKIPGEWWQRSLSWGLIGSFLGPLSYSLLAVVWGICSSLVMRSWPTDAIGLLFGLLIFGTLWGVVAAVTVLPFFVPPLLAWAKLAPRYPAIETRRGIIIGTFALAACGTLVAVLVYRSMDEPFGLHGAQQWGFGFLALALMWLALALPRFLIPGLRPGAFATRSTGGASDHLC
jgi:hypothetical protein